MAKFQKKSAQKSTSNKKDLASAMADSAQTASMNNSMSSNSSQYSFESFMEFVSTNFTVLFLIILFFVGGFFAGSLWTENSILKGGSRPTAAAQPSVVDSGTAGAAEPSNIDVPSLVALAGSLGVDEGELQSCIDSGEKAQEITDEMNGGAAAGVNGTPGTIIVVDGVPSEIIPGALPYAQVQPLVQKYLDGEASQADPALASLPAVSGDDHITGNADARVVLVEYSDYECPFCKQFHPTMKQLMTEYEGDIAWVLRDYPLPFHPNAQKAAEAAECVADIGGTDAFWEFSHAVFN